MDAGSVALLSWRLGRLDEAREEYSRAVDLFAARGATAFEAVHRALLAAVLAALARGVDAATEIERARAEAVRLEDEGLDAAVVLAEAHRALLEARRAGTDKGKIVKLARTRTRRLAARDKDVRALAAQLDAASDDELPHRASLVVADDGSWMTPPEGPRADLPLGSPLRGMLSALASSASESVSREGLMAAAWPGERIVPHAAARRLHAAISELRALGPGARLERTADGYRLAPSLPVVVERTG